MKDPIFKNESKINKKLLLSKLIEYDNVIIENLKFINNYIGNKNIEDIYSTEELKNIQSIILIILINSFKGFLLISLNIFLLFL
jgi:hypothetical protein